MKIDSTASMEKTTASQTKKKRSLKLSFYKQMHGNKPPLALSKVELLDGWYVYTSSTLQKSNEITTTYIYLKSPPISGLRKFLSSHYFRGIGPKIVDTILDEIGPDVISLLQDGKMRFKLSDHVNQNIINKLEEGWKQSKQVAVDNIFLHELALTTFQRRYVALEFGSNFITLLKKSPFETLLKIPRLGFLDMVPILNRINLQFSEEQFILAAASFRLLQSERSYGNTCAPVSALIAGVSKLTQINKDKVSDILEKHDRNFDWFKIRKTDYIQSISSKERDMLIRRELTRIKNEFQRSGSNKKFTRLELKTWDDLKLSDEQLVAVNKAVNAPISIITGGPGAGKTTMVIGLVSALESLQQKVRICAPTGRAAKRIQENPFLEKFFPSTIHSFLVSDHGTGKIDFDVMIVDEASMIDINLLIQLLEKIPDGASIVFIGDPDQLPPVGPGQVFRDMINSDFIEVARLTGNFRQAEFSDIIKAARGVINGKILNYESSIEKSDFVFVETEPYQVAERVISAYFDLLPSKLFGYDQSEFQILSPMRKFDSGIDNLNKQIQAKLSDGKSVIFEKVSRKFEKRFYTGDRVIMTENNYEKGVMNGDVGLLTGKHGNSYFVEFEDEEIEFSEVDLQSLELAYAISIHKSQGSEYPGVIIPITSEHSFMLSRNLIYTAITRGKQQVILIGQKETLAPAVARFMKDRRYTALCQILSEQT